MHNSHSSNRWQGAVGSFSVLQALSEVCSNNYAEIPFAIECTATYCTQ